MSNDPKRLKMDAVDTDPTADLLNAVIRGSASEVTRILRQGVKPTSRHLEAAQRQGNAGIITALHQSIGSPVPFQQNLSGYIELDKLLQKVERQEDTTAIKELCRRDPRPVTSLETAKLALSAAMRMHDLQLLNSVLALNPPIGQQNQLMSILCVTRNPDSLYWKTIATYVLKNFPVIDVLIKSMDVDGIIYALENNCIVSDSTLTLANQIPGMPPNRMQNPIPLPVLVQIITNYVNTLRLLPGTIELDNSLRAVRTGADVLPILRLCENPATLTSQQTIKLAVDAAMQLQEPALLQSVLGLNPPVGEQNQLYLLALTIKYPNNIYWTPIANYVFQNFPLIDMAIQLKYGAAVIRAITANGRVSENTLVLANQIPLVGLANMVREHVHRQIGAAPAAAPPATPGPPS